jgi:competence protein ComEC
MIRACLFLLAGVYALQLSSFTPDSDRIGVAFVANCAVLVAGGLRGLVIFNVGVAIFSLVAFDVVNNRLAPKYIGDSMVTQVRIVDFPKVTGAAVSIVVQPLMDARVPRRVRVSWYEPTTLPRLGDIWQLELRLRRPRGNSNPGTFDYEAWLFRERVGAIGYVVNGHRNRLLSSGDLSAIQGLRQRFVDRVTKLIPETETAAVLAAIAVGARHLVTREQWDHYARTGTSHLMAISGLHIGLAAGGGYFLASLVSGLLLRRGNHHEQATIAALIVAVLYALASGLAVPAQRASLMIALIAIAILQRKQPKPLLILGTACVVLVVVNPLATMAPGFKLSFAAVLVLIWIARWRPGRVAGQSLLRPWNAVRQLGVIQLLLLFGLLPLTVLEFSRVAFVAPPVNLVAVPLFSFVTVPFSLAGLLLDGAFQPLGDLALRVAAASLQAIESLIAMAAELPGANLIIPSLTGVAWLTIATPLLWVILPPGWPGRRVAWVAVAALVVYQPPGPGQDCVDIDVLDVGQGLSIVARTRRHTVIFDTGPSFRGGSSAAKTVVLPYLASRGIRRVDKLIVSHADLDHAGGVAAIVAATDVEELIVGEPLSGFGSAERICRAGEGWRYDGVEFHFIQPPATFVRSGNDASCVLMIETGGHRVLFTGDIEHPVEGELVRNGAVPVVDVVVVPHHGSRTSSTLPFVRALSPAIAIVSAGYQNRWGFPKQDIVERWQAAGAVVHATATSGAIGIHMCKGGRILSVRQHRLDNPRMWYD